MSLFDPATWIELPDATGVPRDGLRPCPCGNARFTVARRVRESGPAEVRAFCPRCLDAGKYGVAIGTLDATAGRFEPNGGER
jgi:hypothetical protein